MKKLTLFFLSLILSLITFSQQVNPSLTKHDYLKKSKGQKTAAWILLGAGTTMMITGSIIWANAVEDNADDNIFAPLYAPYTTSKGTGLTAAGVLCAAGSIPLFIIAAKNKRKAAAVSLKYQFVPQLNNLSFTNRTVPSVNLKINL